MNSTTKLLGNLAAISFVAFAVYGWINNILLLNQLDGMSGELALRAVGIIFAPLGVIMGYI